MTGNDRRSDCSDEGVGEVLAWLHEHSDQSWSEAEIAASAGIPAGTVGSTMSRLQEQGRVERSEDGWRLSDYDRALDASIGHATSVLEERESDDEKPSYEDWQQHAVDPRTGNTE